MKKHPLLLILFLLLALTVQAQDKGVPKKDMTNSSMKFSDLNIKIFNNEKSTFKKPEYHYFMVPYNPSRYFHSFNLTEDKKRAFLDTLKSNTNLRIIRTEKDKRLRLSVIFPKMDVKSFFTIADTKLSFLETNIYSPDDKKVELNGASNYTNNNIDPERENNRIVSIQLKLNKELGLVDSTLNVDSLHGKASFKLSFVTGYDSLRLDRTSISKTFQFGNAELKVIDIIENKVIIQVIHSKNALTSQNVILLNFDSTGNLFDSDFKRYNQPSKANAPGLIPADQNRSFYSMYTIYQVDYDIFKDNPEISYEEYQKVRPLQQKNKPYINYIVYCSVAPLKNSFMLYMPVYGDEQILEAKLSK